MTAEAVESLLTDVVVGEDPRNVEGLWVRMVEHLRKWGHTAGVVMEAISGIDIALWDLAAKSLRDPGVAAPRRCGSQLGAVLRLFGVHRRRRHDVLRGPRAESAAAFNA